MKKLLLVAAMLVVASVSFARPIESTNNQKRPVESVGGMASGVYLMAVVDGKAKFVALSATTSADGNNYLMVAVGNSAPGTSSNVTVTAAATGYIEAFGAIGGTGSCTTPLLNSGWLDFTAWTNVTWSMPPSSGWATLYVEGSNSATAPAYAESGAQINKVQPVGANGIGYITPCPRYIRWYVSDAIAPGVSACIRWRATR